MTTVAEHALAFLEYVFPIVRAGEFMTISGCTVLFYDYFLTLPDEIELIWNARPSTISIIFLCNRYIIPILMIVDIYDRLGLASNPSILFCQIWIWVEAYVTLFSFMSMHTLVAMRVYALHGGPKRLKIILWICGILYVLTTMPLLGVGLYVRQHELAPAPFFKSCYENIAPFLWTIWIPSLLFECLLFILTISKAISEARRNIYSPISSILYRDGILYFLAISGCSMFCMFVWLIGTPVYAGLAKYWATAMVNVAGSRLVLSLKRHAHDMRTMQDVSSLGQSRYSLRFKHSQVSETDESIFTRLPPRSARRSRRSRSARSSPSHSFSLSSFPVPPTSVPFPPGLPRPTTTTPSNNYSSSRPQPILATIPSVTLSSRVHSSSSFVVGRDTYLDIDEYIKLQDLHKHSGYGSSSGTDSNTARPESYQIGTVYPEKYQSHWEAI